MQFKIKSNIGEIQPLINKILAFLKKRGVKKHILHDVKLAVEEAVINAIKHGNRFREAMPVAVDIECAKDKMIFAVQDKGKGYNYTKVPDPTLKENIAKGHGRGVFLIRRLMDEVRFNKSGNRIEMVKFFK